MLVSGFGKADCFRLAPDKLLVHGLIFFVCPARSHSPAWNP
jgi:hypothetical protein